jgi:cadmium resistance protein CadD (predicted permease)
VVFSVVAGARAAAPLASVKEFMSEHNHVIMMVVLLILGAKLVGDGWAGLGS